MIPIGFIILMFFFIALAIAWAMLGRARGRAVIIFRHIGLAVQQNLPLAPAIELAAEGEDGKTRRTLKMIARQLRTGLPLTESLQMAYRGCPSMALSIIREAERTGTLPSAMNELNQRLSRTQPPSESDYAKRGIYFAIILVFFVNAFGLMLYGRSIFAFLGGGSVVPSVPLADLWGDDSTLPPLTQDVVSVTGSWTSPPKTWLGLIFRLTWASLTVFAPVWLVVSLLRLRPRRADHIGMISFITDAVQWWIWPFRKAAQLRGCANSLPTLRLALAAGWPLPDAIQSAAGVDANAHWQRRLRNWAERIRQGDDPIESGKRLHLPAGLLKYLSVALRDNQPDAALVHAENYYICLQDRWRRILRQIFWPLLTVYMGILVGIFCLGLFQGMTAIIDHHCRLIG